jgi:ABC-type transporter MlaC component
MAVIERIQDQQDQFRKLSPQQKARWIRKALAYIYDCPHMADASTFWKGLSARQVIAASKR